MPILDVTVIIPNWNGKEMLGAISLPSLAAQTHAAFSTTVVDNGSVDGSLEFLREEWPGINTIDVGHNSGFAGAVNRGIAATESEFIILLNNDVELDPRWIEEMLKAARSLPTAGSLACRMLDYDDRGLITAVGDSVTRSGHVFWRGWHQRDIGQFSQLEPVFSCCAGAALYRKSAFAAVGLFDESFFAYLEDVDWGFRAQLAGFQCWYVPTALAYHVGGATSSRVSGWKSTLMARNTYLLIVKNLPSKFIIRHAPSVMFSVAVPFYRAFRDGHRRQTVTSISQAILLTPQALCKRRRILQQKRVTNNDIGRAFSTDAPLRSEKIFRLKSLVRSVAERFGLRAR